MRISLPIANTIVMLVAAALLPLAMPNPGMLQVGFLVAAIVPLWATGALPEDYATFLFFAAAVLVTTVPARVVLSGFESDSIWLVFAGLVIGAAVRTVGLDRVLARPLVRIAGRHYVRAIVAVSALAAILSFAIPSNMTRTILIVHLASGLSSQLGLKQGSRGYDGIMVMAVIGSYYWGTGVLTANVPNMVMAGSVDVALTGNIKFFGYLTSYFPILSFVKGAMATGLVACFFHQKVTFERETREDDLQAGSPRRRLVGLVLITCLTLWLTDTWHGISPAWVAMLGAIVLLYPGAKIFPTQDLGQIINLRPFFYAAGILGLGACVAYSGLGAAVMRWMIGSLGIASYGQTAGALLLAAVCALIGFLGSNAEWQAL
jgi:di/tricarboxylate transporter